mgnify:CR=1 FL=1
MNIAPALPILLVDDNPAHRTLVKRAVNKAALGNPIVEAESLKAARAILFASPETSFSLLILDLNLGDGRSTVLMAEIRSSEHKKSLPILALSTSSLPSDINESYEKGCSCFLTKSEDISVFTKQLGAAVKFLIS